MFGLMTNVMLAVTTALAAIGASFAGNAAISPEVVEPPNVDVGGTWNADLEDVGTATGGAHVGDGGANAYGDADTEHVDGSGALDVTGLDAPGLPEI